MKNRLNLDFGLVTQTERKQFVDEYTTHFDDQPLTNAELETIADYILWGQTDASTDTDTHTYTLPRRHSEWTHRTPTESLDALLASPTFDEQLLIRTPTKPDYSKFNRKAALAAARGTYYYTQLTDLFTQIDELDYSINYYELTHKRRTQIREPLINTIDTDRRSQLQALANEWTYERYLKSRHLLVELRRSQFTLRDCVNPVVMPQNLVNSITPDEDVSLDVRPLGLKTPSTAAVFVDFDTLNPSNPAIDLIVHYYWRLRDELNENHILTDLSFDLTNEDMMYQLLIQYPVISESLPDLTATLDYYIANANLSDLLRDVLVRKLRQESNIDIKIFVNKKYGKAYTDNYISTLFKHKVIPAICEAVCTHQQLIESLPNPENWKTCSKCGRTYLLNDTNFVRRARSHDGFSSKCKTCDHKERRERKLITVASI